MEHCLDEKIALKTILIQVPEIIEQEAAAYKAGYKVISEITIERVKRAAESIRKKSPKAEVDTGFRVYRLAESHFPQNLFIPDPEKTEDENLVSLEKHLKASIQPNLFADEAFGDLVTEIALKNGYGLFYSLQRESSFTSNVVYRLSGNDKTALLCLDQTLKDETVEALQSQSDEQLIVTNRALDTTKKWALQTTFKDNLHTV
jgi:adenine-specific DNA-methyltransferase